MKRSTPSKITKTTWIWPGHFALGLANVCIPLKITKNSKGQRKNVRQDNPPVTWHAETPII